MQFSLLWVLLAFSPLALEVISNFQKALFIMNTGLISIIGFAWVWRPCKDQITDLDCNGNSFEMRRQSFKAFWHLLTITQQNGCFKLSCNTNPQQWSIPILFCLMRRHGRTLLSRPMLVNDYTWLDSAVWLREWFVLVDLFSVCPERNEKNITVLTSHIWSSGVFIFLVRFHCIRGIGYVFTQTCRENSEFKFLHGKRIQPADQP